MLHTTVRSARDKWAAEGALTGPYVTALGLLCVRCTGLHTIDVVWTQVSYDRYFSISDKTGIRFIFWSRSLNHTGSPYYSEADVSTRRSLDIFLLDATFHHHQTSDIVGEQADHVPARCPHVASEGHACLPCSCGGADSTWTVLGPPSASAPHPRICHPRISSLRSLRHLSLGHQPSELTLEDTESPGRPVPCLHVKKFFQNEMKALKTTASMSPPSVNKTKRISSTPPFLQFKTPRYPPDTT